MPRSLPIGLALLAALAAAGCSAPVRPGAADAPISAERLRSDLAQLATPLAPTDSAAAARRARYASGRLRGLGLQPALHGSFLVYPTPATLRVRRGADVARAHALGYLPGRNPLHAQRLVLVAAELGTPAAAAVVSALGPLAEEARFKTVPERTVGVALWAPPSADGTRDFLTHPTWALEGIDRVVLVEAAPGAAEASRRLFEGAGLSVEVVVGAGEAVGGEAPATRRLAQALQLAEAVYSRVRAASVEGTTPPDDPRGGPPDSVPVRE